MNYDQTIKQLQTLLEIPLNQEDENWKRIVPLMFAYAENRIYRELEFLVTTTKTTGTLTANNREMTLPITVLVLRQMNVIASLPRPLQPSNYPGILSTRKTLERISLEALDMFWPQETWAPGIPEKFAIVGNPTDTLSYTIRLMPTPDKAYPAEFLGVVRPEPLSPTNTETFLSTQYPELLCAACMVFASGYQRDFGAQADDPAKAMSWNGVYETLRASAMLEVGRMKGIVPATGKPAAQGAA